MTDDERLKAVVAEVVTAYGGAAALVATTTQREVDRLIDRTAIEVDRRMKARGWRRVIHD